MWGFTRYHHPFFAGDHTNADYELFGLLPKVAYAGKEERNAVLVEWIESLGEFKSEESKLRKKIADKGYISPIDWEWFGDEAELGTELSATLQKLRWVKRAFSDRLKSSFMGLAKFKGESTNAPQQNDTGYNLLTLFRLWNIAEYYFPSVGLTNKKWSEVLPEYIPKFINAADSVRWTTAELIAELSDTHSAMAGNPFLSDKNKRLPVEFGFVEGELIVTDNSKYLAEGEEPIFELGDEVVSIEGRLPDWFIEHARKYFAASNENVLLRDASKLARVVSESAVPVIIRRGDEQMEFNISAITGQELYDRNIEWLEEKTYYKLVDNGSVGYLYPGKFKNSDGAAIMEAFAATKAIIIDMRCYPSDFMPFRFVGRYFVPRRVQFATLTWPVAGLPGYYEEAQKSLGRKNNDYYKGKVVVLVNEQTQSSAEYQTMSFQATPDCVVVGSQTAGADGNVVRLPLPGKISTRFSGLGVFYPDGTNTQRVGVRIDHYVTPTIEGIRAGRDEVLEKALEIINMP